MTEERHKFIIGADFAAFVQGRFNVWSQLQNAMVHHTTFGEGTVISVVPSVRLVDCVVSDFTESRRNPVERSNVIKNLHERYVERLTVPPVAYEYVRGTTHHRSLKVRLTTSSAAAREWHGLAFCMADFGKTHGRAVRLMLLLWSISFSCANSLAFCSVA